MFGFLFFSDINYYHCQEIVNILKQTEASSKNLFGQYSSKRMQDWQEIIKLYEKENVYLGEVASLLLRNVNYEVPALRKQIQRTIHLQKVGFRFFLKFLNCQREIKRF